MTPQSELEIKGTFSDHPFAELLAEIAQARLNGSLRLANAERKRVIYFREGSVVFAVSNARSSRLLEMLQRSGKLANGNLAKFQNIANDVEFAAALEKENILTKDEIDALFTAQITGIVADILEWNDGEWTFSSLARIREGLSYHVKTAKMLVEHSRRLGTETVLARFRSLDEKFQCAPASQGSIELTPEESFVLSRAENGELNAHSIVTTTAVPPQVALHSIYTLWMAGMLVRRTWNSAFSAAAVESMLGARLTLVQEARSPLAPVPPKPEEKPEAAVEETPAEKIEEIVITVDEYLERVEKAETYYDVLGIDPKADAVVIKRAYFNSARMFHPDLYHAEGGEVFKRVQNAFTELAQAHETLKNQETREVYDYRVRKELADREKREASGMINEPDVKIEKAEQNFDHGFGLLMDGNVQDALPFLARAAHFAPNNARYRAYYGKALSGDAKFRHKAEGEMQAAIKIDPDNPTFRILLAEFFIHYNLMKRAEGELKRLLAIFPSNREARELLDSIQ